MINRRLIFPLIMFALAGLSFVYGTVQYAYARRVQVAADARMASMVSTIEGSGIARSQKQSLYAAIFRSLPAAPTFFSIDFSGSFASQDMDDQCINDGQRAICRALATNAEAGVRTAVCGRCNPK